VIRRSSAPLAAPIRTALLSLVALSTLPAAAGAQLEADSSARQAGSVGVEYEYVHFEGDLEPWRLASLWVQQGTALGPVIGRVNYADRFGEPGVQLEADAYPRLGPSAYAYLNAGYAPSGFFPTWRFGAELYGNFPGGWEASAGARELRFDSSHVTLYTGSIGKYVGNYWLSLRPYAQSREGSPSASATLTGRRYFADADQFVGASVGYGKTPSENPTPDELQRLSAFAAGLHGAQGVRPGLLGLWSVGFEREELAVDRFRRRWRASLGLRLGW
jgi:YaiO family outer membrane protein